MTVLGNAAAVGQLALQLLVIKPKRGLFTTANSTKITQIIKQVTIEEVHSDEMEITEHPVEQGVSVADHAFARPAEVVITAGWSNSPNNSGVLNQILGAAANTSGALKAVIGAAEFVGGIAAAISPGPSTVFTTYNAVLALYQQRLLFDIYTGKRAYKNMIIKSLATTTDQKTEESLILRITCRQILMATTQTVTVPDSSVMANPSQNSAIVNKGVQSALPSPTYNVNAAP
ncbi:MAG: phage baseplate protein [Janthinobacterium lividum]